MSNTTQVPKPITIGSRAARQVQEFIEAARRVDEQLNVYVMGLAAALDAPEGWSFNVQEMAFLPPADGPASELSLDTVSSDNGAIDGAAAAGDAAPEKGMDQA